MKFKERIDEKISKAVEYLKSIGSKEVFLFGSLIDGTFNEHSDIDLAVSGISARNYFKALVELPMIISHKVDLVALEFTSKEFEKKIKSRGKKLIET
ncbi:MAG: nucleotidyltransferase family protein [Promethearchaeota archaeon]